MAAKQKETIKKALLLFMFNNIGDIVIGFTSATELKRLFPKCEIHAYIPEDDEAVCKLIPDIDKIILRRRKRGIQSIWRDIILGAKFVFERYDIAAAVDAKDATALKTVLTGAKIVTGNSLSWFGRLVFGGKEKVFLTPNSCRAEKYLYALARVGLPVDFSTRTKIQISKQEKENAAEKFSAIGKFAVYCPYGSTISRDWIFENHVRVIDQLQREYGRVFIIGAALQLSKINALVDECIGEIHNLAGKTTTTEMAAILSNASIFVTVDTGPMHLADAMNIPLVAIYGYWDENFCDFRIRGYNSRIVRASKGSEKGIDNEYASVDEVLSFVDELSIRKE